MSSRAFNDFVKEFCDGDPRNIEACHIVQCSTAVEAAEKEPPEVKKYLRELKDEVINYWKGKVNEKCPNCGHRI